MNKKVNNGLSVSGGNVQIGQVAIGPNSSIKNEAPVKIRLQASLPEDMQKFNGYLDSLVKNAKEAGMHAANAKQLQEVVETMKAELAAGKTDKQRMTGQIGFFRKLLGPMAAMANVSGAIQLIEMIVKALPH